MNETDAASHREVEFIYRFSYFGFDRKPQKFHHHKNGVPRPRQPPFDPPLAAHVLYYTYFNRPGNLS